MKLTLSLSDPAQKRKALLIPVLVLGLAWSLSQGEEEPALDTTPREAVTESPALEKRPRAARTKTWNELSLAEITAFNPFSVPEETIAPGPSNVLTKQPSGVAPAESGHKTQPASGLQKWEQQSVSIVYKGPKGPLAVIGERTVGIGDFLDETTFVVDIRQDGVWVSQTANKPQKAPLHPILPSPPESTPDP